MPPSVGWAGSSINVGIPIGSAQISPQIEPDEATSPRARSYRPMPATEFLVEDEIGDLPIERLALAAQRGEPRRDLGVRQAHVMFLPSGRNIYSFRPAEGIRPTSYPGPSHSVRE